MTAPRLFHAFMEETVEALALGPRTLAGLRFAAPRRLSDGDLAHDVKRVVTELRERAASRQWWEDAHGASSVVAIRGGRPTSPHPHVAATPRTNERIDFET